MAQGNFIPKRKYAYKADDYNWLGKKFTIAGTTYLFVCFPAQTIVRQNTILAVDKDYNASIWNGVKTKASGVSDFDINCVDGNEAQYGLIVAFGDTNADVVYKGVSCVFNDASIVGYDNGVARAANADFAVGVSRANGGGSTCLLSLLATADQNYTVHVATGDIFKTNTGEYGVITTVVNGSSMITSSCAQGVTNDASTLVTVTHAVGGLQNFGKRARFTCGTYFGRYINNTAISAMSPVPSINVCTAATIFHINTCVAGSLVKVGDAIKLAGALTTSGTCSFIVTSINNVKAVTVNVGPAVEGYGVIGTIFNINAYYSMIQIDGSN